MVRCLIRNGRGLALALMLAYGSPLFAERASVPSLQPPALAASEAALPVPLAPNLPFRPVPFVFRFSVQWEVMRSGFNALNVALESEAFQETWELEQDRLDVIYLSSPRARIPVAGIQSQGASQAPFDTLILSETALAALLGIQHKVLQESEKWILLELPIRESLPQTFVLTASPRYFISVTLNLSF